MTVQTATSQEAPVRLTYREAMRAAIRDALQRDERVFLMGEDVGRYGGCFGVSKGLLEEFGPQRVRDTPLSESAFVGAGIGAAMGGARPIVEIMTVNFSLLAMDQIVNNAATILHMSGGQFAIPLVIRMTTGAGRQLAAQHSHSLEGWYAHIPGIKVLTPATLEDARGMLQTALEDPDPVLIFEHGALYNLAGELPPVEDPDPVLIFEHGSLYNLTGELPPDAGPVEVDHAAVRRPGGDLTLIAYGGTLGKTLDTETILASVAKTHRAMVVDEGWRSGSISAEISARIMEGAFYELDAPVLRVCSAEVPMPYAKHLEEAALPQPATVVAAARGLVGAGG